MTQWESFYKKYQLVSRAAKLLVTLAIIFVIAGLVCLMI